MEPTEGRWVCRRCFASNEPTATTCEQCGLARGADPSEAAAAATSAGAEQPAWTPPQQPQRPGWMQIGLRYWWVALIMVGLVGGWWFSARRGDSGQIENTGNLQVMDLRTGDCFDLKDESADEVAEVEAKPCTAGHQYEMFHVAEMTSADFPTEDAMDTFLQSECLPAFSAFVGMTYQESVLEIFTFTPTQGSWDDGDHSVQCAAYDPGDAELMSSLRNAAR